VVVGRATRDNPHRYSPGTVEDTVEQLTSDGVDVLGVSADLADPAGVARVIDETMAWKGRCDVLVNNAGYTSNGPWWPSGGSHTDHSDDVPLNDRPSRIICSSSR
jgi:NAD(P)-dependent dehydrogenase (short-subunit alcohol dehydrogenase family)